MRAECGAGSVAAIMMVASIIACSGRSSEPGGAHDRCSSVSACGGSLTGSWNITSTCGQLSLYTFGTDCPGAMLDQSGVCKCTSVILEPPEPYEARGFFSTDGATITYPADA